MEGFTVVDGAVALVILLSGVLAYSRGFVRESLSIVGWIGAAVAAYYFAPMATPLVQEIPILSDFLGDSCELSVIAAFAAVFAVALILISIFTPGFAGAVQINSRYYENVGVDDVPKILEHLKARGE